MVARLDGGSGANGLVLTDNGAGQRLTFSIGEGALASLSATSVYPPSLGSTISVSLGGRIVTLGTDDIAAVTAMGETDSQTLYASRSGEQADRVEALAVESGGQTYVYLADTNDEGLSAYRVKADGSLALVSYRDDQNNTYATGITSLASATVGTNTYVIAASAEEDGLTSYRINADGSLNVVAKIGADDLLPINDPQAIEMVEMAGTQYVIVASSGSSSLTVLELQSNGQLVPVDHVMDDLTTRFATASVLESFTYGDRAYVLAGGGDDGLSLFTVLPDGRLLLLETIADTAATSLSNITDIAVRVVGDEVQLFVVSGSEGGMSQFTITPGPLGDLIEGGSATLNGTAQNDILGGGFADNTINGGKGDDILIDGAGADIMTGGAGADVFVLSVDGETDTILDFKLGQDRLDLSAYGMLYSVDDIEITTTSDGAILHLDGEDVVLISANGLPLEADDFCTADLINVSRIYLGPDLTSGGVASDDPVLTGGQTGDTLLGGAGDQTLLGRGGDDILTGGGGADALFGGEGVDLADYSGASSGVQVNLGESSQNTGDAAGDSFTDIEGLSGSDFDDLLIGDGADNVLLGGAGRDRLEGGDGDDRLEGGADNDQILGHDGNDTLLGGAGNDNISASSGDDYVDGGEGHDQIGGGDGQDTLYGGGGNDTIGSGNDDDFIDAGKGNDVMSGGYGADVVRGGAGNDTLAGSYGNDIVEGGDGDDSLGGGTGKDELYGGAGNDQIGAGSFDDMAWGGTGDDFIGGGDGNDRMWGEDGNDTLNGGLGNDTLYGGEGADIFVFNEFTPNEVDTIQDFELGLDHIRMKGVAGTFDGLNITDVWINGDQYAQIEYADHTIRLAGVAAHDLHTDDFIFL